jgi:hypothetical protein
MWSLIVLALVGHGGCALTLDYDPPDHDAASGVDAGAMDAARDHHDVGARPDAHATDAITRLDGWGVVDATPVDAPTPRDASHDSSIADGDPWAGDAGIDGGASDAPDDAAGGVTRCTLGTSVCPANLQCLSCPLGPIEVLSFCSTPCTTSTDCTDPSRPNCAVDLLHTAPGLCVPVGITCLFGAICASPDTMIATPSGERPIAELRVGDLVYSADDGALVAVPVAAVHHRFVDDHRVVRVSLETGRVLEISPGHPTADGRFFGDLRAGDRLDGVLVLSAELVPYLHDATYDILPASDTGTYVAGGALIGSTLAGGAAVPLTR